MAKTLKKVESFMIVRTAIGKRLVYTYSIINLETGAVTSNQRGDIPYILDQDLLNESAKMEEYINKILNPKDADADATKAETEV